MTIKRESDFDFTRKTIFFVFLFVFIFFSFNVSNAQQTSKKRKAHKTQNSSLPEEKVMSEIETQEGDLGGSDLIKNEVEENRVFTKVYVAAEFPGGESNWRRFLTNNLDASTPGNNGAPAGTYTVIIRFIVDKDGDISDVVAETNHGYGMEQEAVRIIKKSGKWIPAVVNGRKVKSYKRQPISWFVEDDFETEKQGKKKY